VPQTRLDMARIRAARRVIDPVFLDTPLYRCEALEPGLGCTVSIKLETANPVRSFKARGTEVVASLLAGNGLRAVVCASAGNLGQALAWSGRSRGLEVTVVASRFAPAAKLDQIRALDARLELVDGDFDTARERAAALAALCPASRWANIHATTGAVSGSGSSRCARRPQAACALSGSGPGSASRYPYGGRPPRYRPCSRVWVAIAVRTRILVRAISRLDCSPSASIVSSWSSA
jgi:Pyridoxal-phosphate dependent enzyme